MSSLKIGAVVPARIGSKRLPKKNIKDLGGKPMLCWTLDVLLEADVFDDISVSTESDEVADVVRAHYGKSVNILRRPDELAGDDSNLKNVVYHYLDARPDIQWYGLFMPTYPFRRVSKIHDAVRAIYSGYAWKVISVQGFENCSLDYYYPVENGIRKFFSLQPFFATNNTSTYIFRNRYCQENMWQEYGLTLTERVYKLYATFEESIDVDTYDDFEVAQKVVHGYKFIFRKPVCTQYDNWKIITPEGVDINSFIKHLGKNMFDEMQWPILILEKAKLMLNTFRICDGIRRGYWVDEQAVRYLESEKAKVTGNNAYYPIHYKHSAFYRLRRDAGAIGPQPASTSFDCFGIHSGSNVNCPMTIPQYRVLFMEDFKKEPFYVSELVCIKKNAKH